MRRFAIGQLALCLVALGAAPAGASAAWLVQPTANPSRSPSAGLSAISCPATTCSAVGAYATNNGPQPLAEVWDGTSWSLQSVQGMGRWSGELAGVSCTSDTACMAVGDLERSHASRTLAEEWDGSAWSIVSSPNPRGARHSQLNGVSCLPSGTCTAVGSYTTRAGIERTLVESWNGTRWSVHRAARPSRSLGSELLGVSCVLPSTCFAVGTSTGLQGRSRTLVERLSRGRWTVLPTPGRPNPISRALSAVSCTSAAACTAVGDYANRRGYFRALAEQWDGSAWTATTIPASGRFNFLYGVSCPSATSCLAVGQYGGNQQSDKPLVERWDGTVWSPESAGTPAHEASGGLVGVACPSATSCLAVGGYANRGGDDLTLAESGTEGT